MALTCKNCGGNIVYDRNNRTVYCEACGHKFDLLSVDLQDASILQDLNISKNQISVYRKAIRFSDPMSNEALADLEKEISDKFTELKTAYDKAAIITVLDSLIVERNKITKSFK